MWSSWGPFDPKREQFDESLLPADAEAFAASRAEIWLWRHNGDLPLAILDPRTDRLRPVPLPAQLPETHGECRLRLLGEDDDSVFFLTTAAHRDDLRETDHAGMLCWTRRTGELRLVEPLAEGGRMHLSPGPTWWYDAGRGRVVTRGTDRAAPGIPLAWLQRAATEERRGDQLRLAVPAVGRDGGVYAIDLARSTATQLGSAADQLAGAMVHSFTFDAANKRLFVCTSGGLTILTLPEHRVVTHVTADDGLPSDNVMEALPDGDRVYLRCDHADGWTSYHLKSGLIAGSADLSPAERERLGKRAEQSLRAANKTPLLEGEATCQADHGGKQYMGGRGGLVIWGGNDREPTLTIAARDAKELPAVYQRDEAEVEQLRPRADRPDDLARWLRHANPLVRADVVRSVRQKNALSDQWLTALKPALADEAAPVRSHAAAAVARGRGAVPPADARRGPASRRGRVAPQRVARRCPSPGDPHHRSDRGGALLRGADAVSQSAGAARGDRPSRRRAAGGPAGRAGGPSHGRAGRRSPPRDRQPGAAGRADRAAAHPQLAVRRRRPARRADAARAAAPRPAPGVRPTGAAAAVRCAARSADGARPGSDAAVRAGPGQTAQAITLRRSTRCGAAGRRRKLLLPPARRDGIRPTRSNARRRDATAASRPIRLLAHSSLPVVSGTREPAAARAIGWKRTSCRIQRLLGRPLRRVLRR